MPKVQPKISIILPCYNTESTIVRCLDSIKSQTFPNFIVYIIDDGSTDNSATIIKSSIKSDPRFHYFHKPNGGISSARNYGLKKVNTDYLCFIDSDDYIEPSFLESLYQSIEKNHSDISNCSINRIYGSNIKKHVITNTFSDLMRNAVVWNKLYKTSIFKDNHLYFMENKIYEDLNLICKLLILGYKNSIVNEPLYNYIQNQTSLTHKIDDSTYELFDVLDDIISFSKKHHLCMKKYSEIEFIYIYNILIALTYRLCSSPDLQPSLLKKHLKYLQLKFPKWHKNSYIKALPITQRIFLELLHLHQFRFVTIVVKIIGPKIKA